MIKRVLLTLTCTSPLWSSLGEIETTSPCDRRLSPGDHVRIETAQAARALVFQGLNVGYVSHHVGMDGYVVESQDLERFQKLAALEQERLLVNFYLEDVSEEHMLQKAVTNMKVSRALDQAVKEEASLDQLASGKEDISYRDIFENYCKKFLDINEISSRMAMANKAVRHVEHFSELSHGDRWFLRMHLFCLPLDKQGGVNLLQDFMEDPIKVIPTGDYTFAGMHSILTERVWTTLTDGV